MNKLNILQDPLISIGESIDFEQFRLIFEATTLQDSNTKCGRPPFDRVMLFKAMLLQKIYHQSDDQLEYQINDRLSFMRFFGLQMSDKGSDAKTYWYFRESLTKTSVIDSAFVIKFRTRCRVEHIFAAISNRVRGYDIRFIGLTRTTAEITPQNLEYNMTRMIYLDR